jgi:hypothetical protein
MMALFILSYNPTSIANISELLTEDRNAAKMWGVFGMKKGCLLVALNILQPLDSG